MSDGAQNKMRWKCDEKGCFNIKLRPKIERFADYLPRSIKFGDIDACVEINHHQLWLEWKSWEDDVTDFRLDYAHRTLYESQVGASYNPKFKHNHVFVVCGNAETMVVKAVQVFQPFGVKEQLSRPCTFDELCLMIKSWADKAEDVSWQIEE